MCASSASGQTILADSLNDWSTSGTQGANNWLNGYYNLTDDQAVGDGVYGLADFTPFNNDGSGAVNPDGLNHWDGGAWRLYRDTSPQTGPWTNLGQQDTHPNGTNSAPPPSVAGSIPEEHWTIRRWFADPTFVADTYDVIWHTRETNLGGAGVAGRLFVDGSEVDSALITRGDGTGVTRTVTMAIAPGTVIDLALTPEDDDGVGRGDGADGSANRLTIQEHSPFVTQWQLGARGRGWPGDGVGGGPDVDFIQEGGSANPPPGSANSPLGAQLNDDDYYFAGTYPAPIGVVASDELGMERAFTPTDNDLRIHFNLPTTINAADKFRFSFEANNLDERVENPDPRYGVRVDVNGFEILSEVIIRPADLNTVFTSIEFTAGDVGAALGPGFDNILTLTGVPYNGDGGGSWMGMDFHKLEVEPIPEPSSFLLALVAGVLFLPFARRMKKR